MSTPVDSAWYISLETFKKNGSGVKTPVWFASVDDTLVVGTGEETYKVKRLRNNPKVRLAACNASGRKILGPWYEGTARMLDGDEARRADEALARKYRWQRRAFQWIAKLVGRNEKPTYFVVSLTSN